MSRLANFSCFSLACALVISRRETSFCSPQKRFSRKCICEIRLFNARLWPLRKALCCSDSMTMRDKSCLKDSVSCGMALRLIKQLTVVWVHCESKSFQLINKLSTKTSHDDFNIRINKAPRGFLSIFIFLPPIHKFSHPRAENRIFNFRRNHSKLPGTCSKLSHLLISVERQRAKCLLDTYFEIASVLWIQSTQSGLAAIFCVIGDSEISRKKYFCFLLNRFERL